jgi:hypothetical protein
MITIYEFPRDGMLARAIRVEMRKKDETEYPPNNWYVLFCVDS